MLTVLHISLVLEFKDAESDWEWEAISWSRRSCSATKRHSSTQFEATNPIGIKELNVHITPKVAHPAATVGLSQQGRPTASIMNARYSGWKAVHETAKTIPANTIARIKVSSPSNPLASPPMRGMNPKIVVTGEKIKLTADQNKRTQTMRQILRR